MLRLVRWSPGDDGAADDGHDDYRRAVAASALVDPVRTLRGLSDEVGVPVGALARHALAEWASAGNDALLALGPRVVRELAAAADEVDRAPGGHARDEAWRRLRGRIAWLASGVDAGARTGSPPVGEDARDPGRAGEVVVRRRVGSYGLAVDDERGVLLVEVASGYPGAGRWTLPGGGLEHGEDPLDGLVREFHEETGLTASPGPFLLSDSNHLVDDALDLHLLRLVWRVQVPTGVAPRVVEESGSTARVAWVGWGRLQHLRLLSVATRALEQAGLWAPPPDRTGGAV